MPDPRVDSRLSGIPVVALSARDDARPLDAADHLRKPVTLDLLLSVVSRFCA